MASSARELLGWTAQRWATAQDAVEKALARTAKCRRVVPKGPDQIGEKAVIVPNFRIQSGSPLRYGTNGIATPVHLYVNIQLDDQHVDDEAAILGLIEAGASLLGALEDYEIIHGAGNAPGSSFGVRAARNSNPALLRGRAVRARGSGSATTLIRVGGVFPTGQEIIIAITEGIAHLETAGRPGPYGLLLHNRLLAVLRIPAVAGASPLIQQVEQLIGSSEIASTSALSAPLGSGNVCGILLRLEPAAIDLVQTQKPAVTVLGRANGETNLRIEEEIVVREADRTAVHFLRY